MRIVLTGFSSSPGFKTGLELSRRGFDVFGIYNTHEPPSIENVKKIRLDLTDSESVISFLNEVKPDIVIHMAALGDVDRCEQDRELAWRVNVESTRTLAKYCAKHGIPMIYLSTDYVFDGERGLYREDEPPCPVNYYGLTKLVAEEVVKSLVDKFLIIRTSAIYGLGPGRPNFGKVLIEKLSKGEKVRALVDQYLSPTLNTLLAKAVVELLEKNYWNDILHIAGERVNRYEFAIKLAEKFGFNKELIEPIYMKDIQWKARRPRDSSLDVSKARKLLTVDFYTLDNALRILYEEYTKREYA